MSQKEAVIKLIESKYREKRYMKIWKPISLLNLDKKLETYMITKFRIENDLKSLCC